MEKKWLELPWQKVRDSVEVKLWSEDGELFVLAKSEGRREKEMAMRRRRLVNYLRALRKMRHSLPARDKLMMRIGAAKSKAGRAAAFVQITFRQKMNQSLAKRLRSNWTARNSTRLNCVMDIICYVPM
jgi:pyruvate dehydrogenase complex dehydrogenase (E1) component